MRAGAWAWLGVLALPGCLLIQPLDDAKPAGSGGGAHAGQHAGGGPAAGGAGNKGGSGPTPSGGSGPSPSGGDSNGGGSGGADFSLYLGDWKLISGDYTRQCGTDSATTGAIAPGEVDSFVPGTQASKSDLIFDLEGMDVCDIHADVLDGGAYGNGNQSCTVAETDGTTTYLQYTYFEFVVSDDGQSALGTWDVSSLNDADVDACDTEISVRYQRTTPNN